MKIVICPNDKCKTPIRLSEGRFLGGENDKGGVVIECEVCKTIFPCRLKNPYDISSVIKNGKKLDDWTEDLPDLIANKYNVSKDQLDKLDISLVFGYEPPPKINWEPSDLPLFLNNNINLEKIAKQQLIKYITEIDNNYRAYYHLYVKGRHSAEKSFVIINYEYLGTSYKAVFAKEIDSERDLNTRNLYLIYHSGVNIEYQVDGIYTRDQLLVFLERFLNRWRYTAKEVLLIVPFIGFNYKNTEDALYQLWNWLEINVDISKTKLITRKGTFNLFKNAQDNTGIPFEELVKLGLLEPLIDKMNQKDTEYFQKSHAKYYVGVFDNYVEVLSGSFNIHQGKYFENINYRKYDKTFFKERYLHMFTGFEYSNNVKDEYVHYMTFGINDDDNYLIGLTELLEGFE
jgi:hypothetical protein